MNEELFNRFCNLLFCEEGRLQNDVVNKMNFIVRYAPSDPEPYIKLAQARAVKEYFDKHVFTLLDWLEGFVQE